MRREIEEREPARDPVLAAALLEAYADEPLAAERAAVLRHRIRARAEALRAEGRPAAASAPAAHAPAAPAPAATALDTQHARAQVPDVQPPATLPLRRHRAPPAWLGRRARIWAPVALAAALAGVLLLGRELRQRAVPAPPPAARAVGFASAEQALSANLSDADFARVVTLEDDPAALLELAVTGARARPTP